MAKGQKTGGRMAGTPNKVTTAFKDAVRIVYEDIGGNAAFAAWAAENPSEFYRIAARLIPAEVHANVGPMVHIVVNRDAATAGVVHDVDPVEPVKRLDS